MFFGTYREALDASSRVNVPERHFEQFSLPDGSAGAYTVPGEIGALEVHTVSSINDALSRLRAWSSSREMTPELPHDVWHFLEEITDSPPTLLQELLTPSPDVPWYSLHAKDEPQGLHSALDQASRDLTPQQRGRRLEDAVADALEAVGLDVQRRVRLAHGEADILICHRTIQDGIHLTLVECKEQSRSRRRVTLSPVLKLLGLRTATRTGHSAHAAVMVSTSGYTRDASRAATAEGIALVDYEVLMDHLRNRPRASAPLLRYNQLTAGQLRLTSTDVDWLAERDLTILGVMDRVEIWGDGSWDRYSAVQEDAFNELSGETFPGV